MRLAALLLCFVAPAAWALDFRPAEQKAAGEGGEYGYLQFYDKKRCVTYVPPARWDYSGRGGRFRLMPPNVTQADLDMEVQTLRAPMPVESTDSKAFEALARGELPEGAGRVETVGVTPNPLEIDGHRTIEVTLIYAFHGGMFKASYLYLARGNELLRFRVACKAADFDELRQTFQASLHTLAGL